MIIDMIFSMLSVLTGTVTNSILGPVVMPAFLVQTLDFIRELILTGAGPMCYIIGPTVFRMYVTACLEIWGVKLGVMTYRSVRNLTV